MALKWEGDRAAQAMRSGSVSGLNKGAEYMLGQSNARVPVDTTDLRKSGTVHQATSQELESGVAYNTPYAVAQHERTDYSHPTDHNPGAQSKFLESVVVEQGDDILRVVAAEIRRAFA
ncbi:hypothetical protein [Pseudoclavibacter helvolus]|uniref:HK97 gp10 family phage protein n=1 Tax=Pseudoclavibacter helvolus TaxID=255205 RepID=A0A7W4URW2_9MICO|nr:hypothetical protein [Pseudoclavibacter helvolus]MBB2959497.1 hypothetical protein [Pseudoclavibacter helvolus]